MKLVNKKFWIIAIVILVVLIGGSLIYYFTKEDENSLTVTEREWIENNKNNLIDLSIPSDTPVLSSDGEGVIFDFLNDLEEDTGLEFNKLSYSEDKDPSSDYAITVTNSVTDDDILIYQDNYALVAKNKIQYNNVTDIKNVVIGVFEDDMDTINKYLLGSQDVTYKPYKNIDDMIKDMENNTIDIIAIPKLAYLNDIITNENLNIAYNITEYTRDYVLKLGNTNRLNNILTKYYQKWQNENFEDNFNTHLINNYFDIKKIDEKDQVDFRSKRYNYGFVLNNPFDITTREGLKGFNHTLLNSFSKATNIEINYKRYSSIENLINDFESNNLDIIFNYHDKEQYKMDVYITVSPYDEQIVIISDDNNDLTVNSINSLENQTVKVVKGSQIAKFLTEHGVKTTTYDNTTQLLKNLNQTDLAAIDYYTYDSYVRTDLNHFKSLATLRLDSDYNFVSRDIKANETFNELFDFYLSFIDDKQLINNSYKDLLDYTNNNRLMKVLITIFGAVVLILVGVITGKYFKRRKNHNSKLSKTDKLRYIDSLTSLKNRNYLNDNVAKWDTTDVYPQSVIIVDLNNVAYINDNFGHTEGDKVIVEGASILINNQLPNSEIIRTSGNEFLVFIIGQDEKAIVSYIRKLHKEFKKLSHGFGAAIGYSMITDEIKTVDDAVNEATLDMRNNKQEAK